MADGSSTSPSKETVTLRLPSGEMVDAIVPAGISDADVKSYVRMKRPDLFGAPTSIASMPGSPQSQPQPTTSTGQKIAALLASRPYNKVGGFQGGPQQDMPGSTEGPGMMRGLAEYSVQGPGSMGQGMADLAQGNIARGGHELLSGGMNTLTPLTPLVAPAAPWTLARGLIGGTAGGYLGQRGAQAMGLTPDQQALVGDIGTLAGGYGGAKAPELVRGASPKALALSKLLAQEAAAKVPVAGHLVRRPSLMDYVRAAQTKASPEVAVPKAEIPPSKVSTTPPESISKADQLQQARVLQNVPIPAQSPAAPQSGPIPAVRDMSTILPRLRAIAQQIQAQEATTAPASGGALRIAGQETPANTELTSALQQSLPKSPAPPDYTGSQEYAGKVSKARGMKEYATKQAAELPPNRIQGKVMQVLRKEGPGMTIGIDRLMKSPELEGISREQVLDAARSLRDSAKVWGHTAGPNEDIVGLALRKR